MLVHIGFQVNFAGLAKVEQNGSQFGVCFDKNKHSFLDLGLYKLCADLPVVIDIG